MRGLSCFVALCLVAQAPVATTAFADDDKTAPDPDAKQTGDDKPKKQDAKKKKKKKKKDDTTSDGGKVADGAGSGSAAPPPPVYNGPKATLPSLEVTRLPADAKPVPPRAAGANDAATLAILGKLVAGDQTAIAELDKAAPKAIEAIGEWLVRPARASIDERRAVLVAIKAAVPDKTGKFNTPYRSSEKELKADDAIDWMPLLLAQGARPALGEVIADIAAMRALAATHDPRAATYVLDVGFTKDTMIYRDEVGRILRKMEPYSIPALTRGAQSDGDKRRYATFQLERLDRQEPGKAMAAAGGDEALAIAILDVFRSTKHREAVHTVWQHVNHDSPRLRQAAREAFVAYILGPPPPPAPMKHLQLPGGKQTKKPKPLWLTYRELADNELRKAANELLHEDYPIEDPSTDDHERYTKPVKIDMPDVTARLFGFYDEQRAKSETAQWLEAKTKADANDVAGAVTSLDRLLAQNADHGQKIEMAKVYLAWGKVLEGKSQWPEAAAAFSKAHGLDPEGAGAKDALAAHHFAMGKTLEAAGKDGGPDFRRAIALKPDYAPAKTAEAASASGGGGKPTWMLYAAASAGAIALLLFAAAMIRRRQA